MKTIKLTLIISLFLFCHYINGQVNNEDIKDKNHTFIYDIELNQCLFNGNTLPNKQVLKSNWSFKIRNIVTNKNNTKNYIISVTKFKEKGKQKNGL